MMSSSAEPAQAKSKLFLLFSIENLSKATPFQPCFCIIILSQKINL